MTATSSRIREGVVVSLDGLHLDLVALCAVVIVELAPEIERLVAVAGAF